MHKYLRAVGFSKVKKREELQDIINKVVESTILRADENAGCSYVCGRDITADDEDRVYAELYVDFAPNAGVCVRGEFDDEGSFLYEYYFPYLRGSHISSYEDVTIERHMEKESYAGVCDDLKVGVTLIFYLQNMIPYKRLQSLDQLPVRGTSLILSALCTDGMIMMPIIKNEHEKERIKKASYERNQLLNQARNGDEEAIESLTLDDMDTYTIISRKIHDEDVFSLVDTYFMPYGVECDLYSILGEITEVGSGENRVTGEELFFMTVECNELTIEVCVNKEDLFGEPAVGRRFKGVVWLQGYINFPE